MKVKETLTFTLTNEQIDSLVVNELKEIYEQQQAEINRLYSIITPLEEYQKQDLKYCIELRNATRVLLEYHLSAEEAEQYFNSIDNYDY
jgi:hypothetical protein